MINQIEIPMHLDWMSMIYYENRGVFESYHKETNTYLIDLHFIKNMNIWLESALGKIDD